MDGGCSESLLDNLNGPQREAVLHTDGPLLVLAGPGSGKTRVITRRAARLAEGLRPPQRILAITFTNKAAAEMRERIEALDVGHGILATTFHAFGARLLRDYHEPAGVPRSFTIFDRDDRRRVLRQAIMAANLDESNWTPAKVEPVISRAKNAMQTVSEFASKTKDWNDRTIATIFAAYEQLLSSMAGLDFDDLITRPARLLAEYPELGAELERRFPYVLVDEFQDTNSGQYRIAKCLTQQHRNLCATGDPDQSIYGWRGADLNNILSFERDFPKARLVRLEQNYRSTKRILSVADRLISGNLRRKAKSLWTENQDGLPVRLIEVEDQEDEARVLAEDIGQQIREGTRGNEIAVFYRVNALSRSVEEAMLRAGIVYQVARGVEFYNRKEIKDVLAYLRVLANPADEVSLLRIINVPARGIGDTTVGRLVEIARSSGRRVFDVITLESDLSQLGKLAAKVRQFGTLLTTLQGALTHSAAEAVSFVVSHSGLRALYDAQKEADDLPLKNIDELINAAAEYAQHAPGSTVMDWLEHTALLSDIDSVKDERGAVTLMTLHAAKGLEFSTVYIIGLEEGLLPFQRQDALRSADVEEERRLFFVGITRARLRLTLLRARYRMQRGTTQRTTRSPFLDELPQEEIESNGPERKAVTTSRPVVPSRSPREFAEWTIGTLVRHPMYGLGQLTAFRRGGSRTHVDVRFRDGELRSWILEFSELKRVEYEEVE